MMMIQSTIIKLTLPFSIQVNPFQGITMKKLMRTTKIRAIINLKCKSNYSYVYGSVASFSCTLSSSQFLCLFFGEVLTKLIISWMWSWTCYFHPLGNLNWGYVTALQRTPTCVRQVLCWRPSQKSHVATERPSLPNWRLFVCHAAGQWIGAGRCIIDTCKSTENNTTGTMGAGRHTCVCVCQKDHREGKN